MNPPENKPRSAESDLERDVRNIVASAALDGLQTPPEEVEAIRKRLAAGGKAPQSHGHTTDTRGTPGSV